MSSVTLETLRADYEAAKAEQARVYADPQSLLGHKLKSCQELWLPFNLYDIADRVPPRGVASAA